MPVRRDPLGVLAGVRVARLDGIGQRPDGRHVRAAQLLRAGALLLEGLAQVGGVALELLLLGGRLTLVAERAPPAKALESPGSTPTSLWPDRKPSCPRGYPSRLAAERGQHRASGLVRPETTSMPEPLTPGGAGRLAVGEQDHRAPRTRRPRRSSACRTACGFRTPDIDERHLEAPLLADARRGRPRWSPTGARCRARRAPARAAAAAPPGRPPARGSAPHATAAPSTLRSSSASIGLVTTHSPASSCRPENTDTNTIGVVRSFGSSADLAQDLESRPSPASGCRA